jgi:hypothetical protein
MKNGKTIVELAQEIERQSAAKRDVVVPAAGLTLTPGLRMDVKGAGEFGVNDLGHAHLAEYTKIPLDYYKRIRGTNPDLLSTSVNTLLRNNPNERRLVRTLDGTTRAVLSDSYRPLDNFDLLKAVLPVLGERSDIVFVSQEVTERRLYLKIIATSLTGEVKRGDEVRAGLLISNSEVGNGALVAAPFSERLVCTNGATHMSLGKRRNHVGKAFAGFEGDEAREFFSDETRIAEDKAFFLKFRDTIKGLLSGDTLEKILAGMRESTEERIEAGTNPAEVVEAVAVNFGMNEGEKTGVLTNLINGGDLSRFGLANAITRTAQDAETYDRASELEMIGGDLMTSGTLKAFKPIAVKATRRGRRAAAAVAVA